MRKQMVALLAGAMLMMATSAMAIPISGTITFSGSSVYTKADGVTTTGIASEAAGIKFLKPWYISGSPFTTGNYEQVNSVTGDYSLLPDPTAGLVKAFYTNFTFAPVLSPNPVTLWSIDDTANSGKVFDFEMTSVTPTVLGSQLSLVGSGILGITGFDDTFGNWSYSSDGTSAILSFSAASAVPEPGTMMLLGIGMLGLAVFGKRRMNKEA